MLLVLVGGGLLAVRLTWPGASIAADTQALAKLTVAGTGEHVAAVTVRDASGRPVAVSLRGDTIWPTGKLASGERLEVRATVRRSSWIGWLVGSTEHVSTTLTTPATKLSGTFFHLAPNAPVVLHFKGAVSLVALTLPGYHEQHLTFAKPRRAFATGVLATGPNRFGVLTVAVAARPWEKLSAPARVSWFPAGKRLQAVVKPAPGSVIEPSTPIQVTFSEPISAVLGKVRPTIDPATSGTWIQTAPNALTFKPRGAGYPLGRHVVVTLPAATDVLSASSTQTVKSLTWSVPVGSTLRLQQLLSQLGYLPLTWTPASGSVPDTALEQKQAALHAPAGKFTWRYPNTPAQLQSLWAPNGWTRMTQGAVMAFEADHGLTADGIPGPIVWHTLISAALQGDNAHSYSYVLVHRSVPQTLTLWNNGETILTARVNTGVPAAPTPFGTHAVFEHISVGTMRGQNPDGSHYVDPGIKWISYFNGGEAIHGFNRGSYGFPQSVGCVEAPIDTAGKIWPYTPIGTLVTIVP
ncbi:MAG TPA: L,D-transpeptidase family protein [Gaiellaceae bacterium]|nr:L,D-transpeptidase family protein [Gaiellaceae bacterium]